MSWNFFIRVARFSYEFIMELCLPLGLAIINSCYNLVFRNRNREAEWLVNYNSGEVTTSVDPAFANAISMISSKFDDAYDAPIIKICPCALSKQNVAPEYVQRSCVVEMERTEPQEEPPIPVEMAPDAPTKSHEEPPIQVEMGDATEIPIEKPGDPQPRRLSYRTQRLRELCSSQRVRRLHHSFCLSSPSTSSSTAIQPSAADLSQSIPYPDWIDFENEQINVWINNIVDTTDCSRAMAINALF